MKDDNDFFDALRKKREVPNGLPVKTFNSEVQQASVDPADKYRKAGSTFGFAYTTWAKDNDYSVSLVWQLLVGKSKGGREGKSKTIKQRLIAEGLWDGEPKPGAPKPEAPKPGAPKPGAPCGGLTPRQPVCRVAEEAAGVLLAGTANPVEAGACLAIIRQILLVEANRRGNP